MMAQTSESSNPLAGISVPFPPQTPCFCHVHFHRKSTPEDMPIPTTIGCGFGLHLPTEKTLGNYTDVGFALRRFTRFYFAMHSGQLMSPLATLWLRGYPNGRRCQGA
jgi:hypothetical protein